MPASTGEVGLAIPAAQYLRMSREHQRYSMRNQAQAIAAFAAEHGYEIQRTYSDPGRSGLNLSGRPGLKALLADAMSSDRRFRAVLVLDVSRWGRFQDLDQSAHYEFLCREAGVPIVYCAEVFENDGSPMTMLMKQIKRLMAAEYSRELSTKVRRAQLLQARLGHKQGGSPHYGFRRVMVDRHDQPIVTLQPGQFKAFSDQRVIHARGPEEELAVIRNIFRLYTREHLSIRAVARNLNEMGVPSKDGEPWTQGRVKRVLCNPLVLGLYVFNRTSRPLRGAARANPPDAWVTTRVLEPTVSRTAFDLAKMRMSMRRADVSQEEALRAVRRLLRAGGRLSDSLIYECAYTPGPGTLRRLFGSMRRVYELVGYAPGGWWRPTGQACPASDAELLALLRRLAEQEGYVSQKLITADRSMPSPFVFHKRFGSLTRAYELAGLPHSWTELRRAGFARSAARVRHEPPPNETTPRWPSLPTRFTDDDLLECLRRLYSLHGRVSARLINCDDASPGAVLFAHRFGALSTAYERAGLPAKRRGASRPSKLESPAETDV